MATGLKNALNIRCDVIGKKLVTLLNVRQDEGGRKKKRKTCNTTLVAMRKSVPCLLKIKIKNAREKKSLIFLRLKSMTCGRCVEQAPKVISCPESVWSKVTEWSPSWEPVSLPSSHNGLQKGQGGFPIHNTGSYSNVIYKRNLLVTNHMTNNVIG